MDQFLVILSNVSVISCLGGIYLFYETDIYLYYFSRACKMNAFLKKEKNVVMGGSLFTRTSTKSPYDFKILVM